MRRCAFILLGLLVLLAAPADAAERSFRYKTGPYTLGAFQTSMVREEVRTPRVKGFVTRLNVRMVDRRGRPVRVDEGMLHHLYLNNLGRRRAKQLCPGPKPELFYGTGEEDETMRFPPGYGYRLDGTDRWRMDAMLMSHRYRPSRVFLEFTGRVETRRELTNVRPFWVRAAGCGKVAYHVGGGAGEGSVDDQVIRWRAPMTGRIVAAGGHLHAGARNLELREPACDDRVLYDNKPFYAPADDLLYRVEPRLHEPGPVQTSWFTSREGIPVRRGRRLDLHGLYDGEHPRQSVMAITHLYLAPGGKAPKGCPELPDDRRQTRMRAGLRSAAEHQQIPLYRLNARNRPVEMAQPPGATTKLRDGATINLRNYRFEPTEKVVLRAGATIKWRFRDDDDHNITYASGPRALAGETFGRGGRAATRFDVPGRYQFFCSFHPMTMREQITVVP